MSGPQKNLKCSRKTCIVVVAKPPGLIQCEECRQIWCCMECCIEDDSLDHEHFDMIYDHEGKHPAVWSIVCCRCSGNKKSWEDRDD